MDEAASHPHNAIVSTFECVSLSLNCLLKLHLNNWLVAIVNGYPSPFLQTYNSTMMTLVVSKCFALSNWYRWVFEHVADKTIDCSDEERELQHFLQILQRPLTTMSWSLKARSEIIIIDPTWHDKKPELTFLCRFPLNHCTSNNSSCVGSHSLTLETAIINPTFTLLKNFTLLKINILILRYFILRNLCRSLQRGQYKVDNWLDEGNPNDIWAGTEKSAMLTRQSVNVFLKCSLQKLCDHICKGRLSSSIEQFFWSHSFIGSYQVHCSVWFSLSIDICKYQTDIRMKCSWINWL